MRPTKGDLFCNIALLVMLALFGNGAFCFSLQTSDTTQIRILNNRMEDERYWESYPDSIFFYATIGLRLATNNNYVEGMAEMNRHLGIYHWVKGDYSKAIEYYRTAIHQFNEVGKTIRAARTTLNLGQAYSRLGDYGRAINYYTEAIKVFEQDPLTYYQGLGNSWNSLGIVYREFRNYPAAIDAHKNAIKSYVDANDVPGQASMLGNLAEDYYGMGQLDSAKVYDLMALQLFETYRSNSSGHAGCYISLAEIAKSEQNYVKARDYLNKALAISRERDFFEKEVDALISLGDVSFRQKKYQAAITSLSQAEGISRAHQYRKKLTTIYDILARCYSSQGDVGKSNQYYENYVDLRDSLFTEENATLLSNLRVAYETEQKDAAIEGLQQSMAIMELRRDKETFRFWTISLISALGLTISALVIISLRSKMRKEKFEVWKREQEMTGEFNLKLANSELAALKAQMNPHFLFNSLNSINRYIIKSDPDTASTYLTRFARLIRLILENSMSSSVTLEKEIEAVKLYLDMETIRFENKFTFDIIVSNDLSPADIMVPPMIIQPYVENSIWHGVLHKKDDGGHIILKVDPGGDFLTYTIEDNGVGRSAADRAERSNMHQDKKSFGMQITSNRLRLLTEGYSSKSSVRIIDLKDETGEPSGTRVIIKIPRINAIKTSEEVAGPITD